MLPEQKLDALITRHAALERDLSTALPAETYVKLSREFAELAPVVDAVKSYQAVIEAHEAGMAKFVPAFQALYDSMSDAQKASADSMFRGKVSAAAAKKST